jgi:hypothetical protein
MTVLTDIPVDQPTKVSARDKWGRIQTITIGNRTINADELEPLSKQLHDPKVQEQMRKAFGIQRHRQSTIIDRMIDTLRHHFFN